MCSAQEAGYQYSWCPASCCQSRLGAAGVWSSVMHWRAIGQSHSARRLVLWTGWAVVLYVVTFWRLGFPSFWDPDEAVYAVASREMLRTGDWLAPMFNGKPFFDKPILFYWLQLISFRLFGINEFAARLVPAMSAIGVIGVTGWAGRVFFNRQVGLLAALMVAVVPATFALSAYAILDMTFTLFLFAGVVLAASSVLHHRPHRQWWGYVCLALAVLTKGPLAIVLAGVSFLLALVIAPGLRRALLSLHWIRGLVLVIALSSPWFLYMWWRFGYAFIEGYFLRENIWLFAVQLYATSRSPMTYFRVAAIGFLPFTPILIGRAVDALRGDRVDDAERLFWAWAVGITAFFSLSRFKLDHYIYPVLPALAVIVANTWWRLRQTKAIRPQLGAAVGVGAMALLFIGTGAYAFLKIDALPGELSRPMLIAPIALLLAGAAAVRRVAMNGWRPPAVPISVIGGLLVVYAVVLGVGLEALERGKPMKDLGTWVGQHAPDDAIVTAYRLERWKTSWGFYSDRPMQVAETPAELMLVLSRPGTHYAVMQQDELDAVLKAAPEQTLRVVRERKGMSNTGVRGLRRKREDWPTFVVVTNTPAIESPDAPTSPVVRPGRNPAARPRGRGADAARR